MSKAKKEVTTDDAPRQGQKGEEVKMEMEMETICPGCGYEKCPEEWGYKLCSDCRENVDCEDDWFR